MCTNIIEKVDVAGSAKGARGWMAVDMARVSFDHPAHADLEYSLNIDFVNASGGGVDRVAVELSAHSARELLRRMRQVELSHRAARALGRASPV